MFVNIPSGIIEDLVKQEASAALEHEGNIRNISMIIFQFNSLIYVAIYKTVNWANRWRQRVSSFYWSKERDLERLLSQSNNALSNAEKFMEQLSKDLSLLDGVCLKKNIQNS